MSTHNESMQSAPVNCAYSTIPLPATLSSGDPDVVLRSITQVVSVGDPAITTSPLAFVDYEIKHEKQRWGLRIDLDKLVFLDHYSQDPTLEQQAAQQILSFLARRAQMQPRAAAVSGD